MLVKVWNRNTFDHVEKFRNKQITIKAGSYTQMDYHDAIDFLGQFWPPRYGKGGQAIPESFKYLEMDHSDVRAALDDLADGHKEKSEKCFVCGLCNREFATKGKLIKHVATKHKSQLTDPDEVEDLADEVTED